MVDPVTVGAALVKKAAEDLDAAVKTFFQRVLGEPGMEIGAWLADRIHLGHWKSAIRMMEKAERFATARGYEVTPIPRKVSLPLFDGVALEDENDEPMIDRWAALLANAATDSPAHVPPAFPRILAELEGLDARALEVVVSDGGGLRPSDVSARVVGGSSFAAEMEARLAGNEVVGPARMDNLVRLGLCRETTIVRQGDDAPTTTYAATAFGRAFVEACQPPGDRKEA